MKKLILIVAIAGSALLSSCITYEPTATCTATAVEVSSNITTNTIADLEVGNRVIFTYKTTSQDRSGYNAVANCKVAAVNAMLKTYNNADVIVAPEFKFDSNLKEIEVSGRPATYKNFRNAE